MHTIISHRTKYENCDLLHFADMFASHPKHGSQEGKDQGQDKVKSKHTFSKKYKIKLFLSF